MASLNDLLIFHDSLDSVGGAEKLVATLSKAFHAKIVSTNVKPEAVRMLKLREANVYDLGHIGHSPPFGPIKSTILFRTANFPGYEKYIFSGSWAHYASYKHKPNIYYCHTPCRVFYDLKDFNIESQTNAFKTVVAWGWASIHGWVDRRSISQIDQIIANSMNVQSRIKKYYQRDSSIIYPPIATEKYKTTGYENFWLSVNRLYPEKRIDLQIEAFKEVPCENLFIVGGYSEKDRSLKRYHNTMKDVPANVTIRGPVAENELIDLYARCKGVIYTAIDEDFGMVPVEAQASGKAVVGVDEGGLRETVLSGVTGFLVPPDAHSIVNAVKLVSRDPEQFRKACIENSKKFDERIFIDRFEKLLKTPNSGEVEAYI